MPAKYLSTEKSVRKHLKKLPFRVHEKIIKTFDVIQGNPLSGAKLHGELKNYYKYRVGDYRIVYQFNSRTSTVIVVKVEHRQGVYR